MLTFSQSYYAPNANRKNLVVLTGSIASRILFRSGTSPLVATGVEFLNGERKYEVEVRKEVIVSAGKSTEGDPLNTNDHHHQQACSKPHRY